MVKENLKSLAKEIIKDFRIKDKKIGNWHKDLVTLICDWIKGHNEYQHIINTHSMLILAGKIMETKKEINRQELKNNLIKLL